MLYLIIITTECNRSCRYCGGKLNTMPKTITYNINDLATVIKQDPNPQIAFYGGEPLLNIPKIKEIIDTIPNSQYILNTNGYQIANLDQYIHQIDTILLSIDGRQETTDFYRGAGCTQQVLNALSTLKTAGYAGELIARMTVSHHTNICEDVNYLLPYFPYIHWQLDVVWSSQWTVHQFQAWAEQSYKPGLHQLIQQFNTSLKDRKPIGIVPFLGIITRMLHGGNDLPCGAGSKAITIATDGQILACPIAPEFHWNMLGDINAITTTTIGKPCTQCDVYRECGGRCLFFHKEWLWGTEGFTAVCNVTKFLIKELRKHKQLYQQYPQLFHYPTYNNTTEIIP